VGWSLPGIISMPAGFCRVSSLDLVSHFCVAFFLVIAACGSGGAVRFRVPVVPLLAIVAALGYFPVVEKAKTSTSDWRSSDEPATTLTRAAVVSDC
jgi:hypothetical protein